MAIQKYYDLQKGAKVGVITYYSAGRSGVHQQGIYTVTKCNGAVCEITRESDGYVRTFSNRTGCEKHSYGTSSRYNTAQLISTDRYESLTIQKQQDALRDNLWKSAAEAANRKNLSVLRDLIGQLEANAVT